MVEKVPISVNWRSSLGPLETYTFSITIDADHLLHSYFIYYIVQKR